MELTDGSGSMKLGSGVFEGRYSFKTQFENEPGTNPEELIAAADAACFSTALALMLGQAGFALRRIHTTAKAHIEKVKDGFKITHIDLNAEAAVPHIREQKFHEQAEAAKNGCPCRRRSLARKLHWRPIGLKPPEADPQSINRY